MSGEFWQGRPIWFDVWNGVRAGIVLHHQLSEDVVYAICDGKVEHIFGSQAHASEAEAWESRARRCILEAAERIADATTAMDRVASCRILAGAGAAPTIPTEPAP